MRYDDITGEPIPENHEEIYEKWRKYRNEIVFGEVVEEQVYKERIKIKLNIKHDESFGYLHTKEMIRYEQEKGLYKAKKMLHVYINSVRIKRGLEIFLSRKSPKLPLLILKKKLKDLNQPDYKFKIKLRNPGNIIKIWTDAPIKGFPLTPRLKPKAEIVKLAVTQTRSSLGWPQKDGEIIKLLPFPERKPKNI